MANNGSSRNRCRKSHKPQHTMNLLNRFNFVYLALVLLVASLAVSVARFYVDMAQAASSLDSSGLADGAASSNQKLWAHLRDNYLFAGQLPGWFFWLAVVMLIFAIVKPIMNLRRL